MMPPEISQDQSKVWDQLAGLWAEVVTAAPAGTAAHEVERRLFRGVLPLGYDLLGCFFRLVGPGDGGSPNDAERWAGGQATEGGTPTALSIGVWGC